MPGTSLQKIITTHPNFTAVDASDELIAFTQLCVQRIRSCQEGMAQEEIDVLCYLLCSVSNFEAFNSLYHVVMECRATLGISEQVYKYIIKTNLELMSPKDNRTMHPYGLKPDTSNLVNKVMMLAREGVSYTDVLDPQVVESTLLALQSQISEAEQIDLDFLERQLCDGPTKETNLDKLLDICKSSKVLEKFLDRKRNEGNQNTSYISGVYKKFLVVEEELSGSQEEIAKNTASVVNLMEILFNAIDRVGFESQEIILTELFLKSDALALLEWLEKVVKDEVSKAKLQTRITTIYLDSGEEAPNFASRTVSSDLNLAMAEAVRPLTLELSQAIQMPKLYDYFPGCETVMDEDTRLAILLSLQLSVQEPQSKFGSPWITKRWHSSEIINEFLLKWREPLAEKGYGVMSLLTTSEALDFDYVLDVVQGKKGIIRPSIEGLAIDAPRAFEHLLYPTGNGVHYGLLMLSFDSDGKLEKIVYFEPRPDFEPNLVWLFNKKHEEMGSVSIEIINMGQADDDFCGDYVIALIKWFAEGKIKADCYNVQTRAGVLPIETIEYLRCEIALDLGLKFVQDLQPKGASLIPESQWEAEILPAIKARHTELSQQGHAWVIVPQQHAQHDTVENLSGEPVLPMLFPGVAHNINAFFANKKNSEFSPSNAPNPFDLLLMADRLDFLMPDPSRFSLDG